MPSKQGATGQLGMNAELVDDQDREAQASFAGTAFRSLKEVPANGRCACGRRASIK
jgi:hypothetical protein